MKKKVCVVTGSRAEYGLLKNLIRKIHDDVDFELQLLVTGSHLSKKFGQTFSEIERDGFPITRKIKIVHENDDTGTGIAQAMSECLSKCALAFRDLTPDLVLLLGDRYEIFAAAAAATSQNLPIAHLHGGEITSGALDDAFRHSITKMSHLHFVANQTYRNRVIQLGEHPEHVFDVGGLGVDAISSTEFISQKELEESLGIKFGLKNLIVTFHPETIDHGESRIDELFQALSFFPEINLIFTLPNADQGSDLIISKIHNFVQSRDNAVAFASLGSRRFLSCLKLVDGMIGNSSSGLAEAPTLNKGSINIGNRQLGRMQATSVINCELEAESITEGIRTLYSEEFKRQLNQTVNPYGRSGASERIFSILKSQSFDNLKLKHFIDLL